MMTEELITYEHLSVAMTTAQTVQTTDANIPMTPSSRGIEFYFECAVILIGIVGMAANGLVLYAMVASQQHKKQVLVFNQNSLDLYTCLLLVITYGAKLGDVHPSGTTGYWLCMMLLSENLLWWGIDGSVINLVLITIERYLKVIHAIKTTKCLHGWMIYAAAAFSWIGGIVYNMALCLNTTDVINGVCYGYVIWQDEVAKLVHVIWNFVMSYIVVLFIFIFCYWRILVVIRRQAMVMAGHSAAGPSTAQTQSNHIQLNIIKTMILVSAFYAVAWLPTKTYYLLVNVDSTLSLIESGYYGVLFISFLYICSNPFIYATKFAPVKRVLLDFIPCKTNTMEPGENAETTGRHRTAITRLDQQR